MKKKVRSLLPLRTPSNGSQVNSPSLFLFITSTIFLLLNIVSFPPSLLFYFLPKLVESKLYSSSTNLVHSHPPRLAGLIYVFSNGN